MKQESIVKKEAEVGNVVSGSDKKKAVLWKNYRQFLINTTLDLRADNERLWNAVMKLQTDNNQLKAQVKGEY